MHSQICEVGLDEGRIKSSTRQAKAAWKSPRLVYCVLRKISQVLRVIFTFAGRALAFLAAALFFLASLTIFFECCERDLTKA